MYTNLLYTIWFVYLVTTIIYAKNLQKNNYFYFRLTQKLTFFIWLLGVVFFTWEWRAKGYLPIYTFFEILYFLTLLLITVVVIVQLFNRNELFSFISFILGFILLTGSLFFDAKALPQIEQSLISHLLFIHIIISVLSYVFFFFTTIFSVLYLILNKMLKEKRWNSLIIRLPNLMFLEKFALISNIVGVVLLFIGIILGNIWARLKLPANVWLDPKVILSYLVLFIYGINIFFNLRKKFNFINLAYLNIFSFFLVIVNFVVSIFYFTFHRWH